MLFLMLACGKHKAPDAMATPIVPATLAPLYSRSDTPPRDEVVKHVAGEVPLDEALSGVAGAVGLLVAEGLAYDRSSVNWARMRAGWPHAIDAIVVERVAEGELPVEAGTVATEARAEGLVVGMARVRDGDRDVWVTVSSIAPVRLSAFPRELAVGQTLSIGTVDAAGYTALEVWAVGPSGLALGPGAVVVDEPGEWFVEVWGTSPEGVDEVVGSGALYVATETPDDGPFEEPIPAAGELAATVLEALNDLRYLEDLQAIGADPVLGSSARSELERRKREGWTLDPAADARLEGLGFSGARAELSCRGPNVSSCLDTIWWSVTERSVLLTPQLDVAGLAVEVVNGQLAVVIDLAQE